MKNIWRENGFGINRIERHRKSERRLNISEVVMAFRVWRSSEGVGSTFETDPEPRRRLWTSLRRTTPSLDHVETSSEHENLDVKFLPQLDVNTWFAKTQCRHEVIIEVAVLFQGIKNVHRQY